MDSHVAKQSATTKYHDTVGELAVLRETFTILQATFQVCVGCDRKESKLVLHRSVIMMPVSANVD